VIARIWHGRTRASRAEAYLAFLTERALPVFRSVPGNRGAYVLHRIEGDVAHFLTLSLWDSLAAIEAFAGPDRKKPKYYPEDEDFLLEMEPEVRHYEWTSEEIAP
jgi:heme-degrading monooxygenase HmoA